MKLAPGVVVFVVAEALHAFIDRILAGELRAKGRDGSAKQTTRSARETCSTDLNNTLAETQKIVSERMKQCTYYLGNDSYEVLLSFVENIDPEFLKLIDALNEKNIPVEHRKKLAFMSFLWQLEVPDDVDLSQFRPGAEVALRVKYQFKDDSYNCNFGMCLAQDADKIMLPHMQKLKRDDGKWSMKNEDTPDQNDRDLWRLNIVKQEDGTLKVLEYEEGCSLKVFPKTFQTTSKKEATVEAEIAVGSTAGCLFTDEPGTQELIEYPGAMMALYIKIGQMFYTIKTFNGDQCCSCLEAMNDENKTLFDPCGHAMCNTCAHEWAKSAKRDRCPICRGDIKHRLLQGKRSLPEDVPEDAPVASKK